MVTQQTMRSVCWGPFDPTKSKGTAHPNPQYKLEDGPLDTILHIRACSHQPHSIFLRFKLGSNQSVQSEALSCTTPQCCLPQVLVVGIHSGDTCFWSLPTDLVVPASQFSRPDASRPFSVDTSVCVCVCPNVCTCVCVCAL